jgi:ribonucleoside-diphosphate reductase alpha chain
VDVKEKEWPGVGAWVWDHFADAGGLTFMPNSDHSYAQAPYEEITESQYETEVENMPEISWGKLGEYENEDNTDGGRELACTAGACAI